jgi:hypothetical protein
MENNMTGPFGPDELKRLNQTAAERLLDWSEENFNRHDYGSKRGRPVGFDLFRNQEDDLYTFVQRLTEADQEEIRQKLRVIEGQRRFLELVLEMFEPGYETEKQTQERLAEQKRLRIEQKRNEQGIQSRD